MPGIVIQIQGDGEGAREALQVVREEMERTREAAEESGSEIAEFGERVKRALEFAGIYLGLEELKEGLKEMVEGSLELAEQLGHLSQQTGISAANLSVLKFAADSSGVSFDLMTAGFRKLSEQMVKSDQGSKEAQKSFSQLGITQDEVRAHTNDLWGMLTILADKFRDLPDGALKSAEATELLGKAGTQLIPILNQGTEGLEEFRAKAQALGIVLDDDGIAKMEQMKRGLAELKGAAQGAGLGFTEGLAPGIAGAASALAGANQGGNAFVSIGQAVGREVLSMAAQFAWLNEQVRQTIAEYHDMEGALNSIGDKIDATIGFTQKQRDSGAARLRADIEEEKQAVKDNQDAIAGYAKIKSELSQAMANYGKTPAESHGSGEGGTIEAKPTKQKKERGDDGIQRAQTSLAEEYAQAQVDAVKASTADALAALDEQHKEFLISDANYYTDKLKLQDQAFDAEIAAMKAKEADLQSLQTKQAGDKKLHRDKDGNSAEELATAKQLLELQSKIAEVEGQKVKAATEYRIAEAQATNAGQLEILKQAAQIETERNQGITARLALLRAENELELQKAAVNYGSSSPQYSQVQQLGQIAEAKLQIQQLDQQIAESEKQNQVQTQSIQDAVDRGLLKKKQAQQEIVALNKAEAELLKQILPMYQQEADYLGGGAKDKAVELQKQVGDLSDPKKNASNDIGIQVGDSLSKGVTSSLDQLASSALKGKVNFTALADSMINDIERIAIKSLEEQTISPFFNSLFGGGGSGGGGLSSLLSNLPGFATGGRPSGPSIIGEEGPELFVPDQPGTVVPNSALKSVASSGGSSPNVNFNVVNNSSQSVNAKETGRSYDRDSKQFIIHAVLEDMQNGGPLSSAVSGMSR